MRNHPATKAREAREAREAQAARGSEIGEAGARERSYGAALLAAIEGGSEELHSLPDVYTLGAREKVTPATERTPERVYTLEGWTHRPEKGDPRRFYILSGGASAAHTVLDEHGQPIAQRDRKGRGLSPLFREWIARAVASDLELCHF